MLEFSSTTQMMKLELKLRRDSVTKEATENNPILEIAKHVVFHEFDALSQLNDLKSLVVM